MSVKPSEDADPAGWLEDQDLTAVERTFLVTLMWMDRRLRLVDYLELLEGMYYRWNLQMP
ncbi:MAG: cytochrome bc complex cytochrome b subunit, partial [Halobacteriaceae archaeon]